MGALLPSILRPGAFLRMNSGEYYIVLVPYGDHVASLENGWTWRLARSLPLRSHFADSYIRTR